MCSDEKPGCNAPASFSFVRVLVRHGDLPLLSLALSAMELVEGSGLLRRGAALAHGSALEARLH